MKDQKQYVFAIEVYSRDGENMERVVGTVCVKAAKEHEARRKLLERKLQEGMFVRSIVSVEKGKGDDLVRQ